MVTQKQKIKLLFFGSIMLILAFMLLAYQNGSLFRSDLLGSDMLNNSLNKVYHRLYSYDVSKNIGQYENAPAPQNQGWIQITNTSGGTGSMNLKNNSASRSLGLLEVKTSGIGSAIAANNWGVTTNDRVEIETRIQVAAGAAGCESSTSSFLLFTNGSKTGYLTFCQNQIIVGSDTQRWQRNSQFAPGAKNTISNIDLSSAPKDLKIVIENGKISIYEQKTTDVLLGEFANAMYTGLPDYTGITNAAKISESTLMFGSFASSIGSTNYGTVTNWGYVRGKVLPLSQFSGTTKGSMSFSYDVATANQKLPNYLGWTNNSTSDSNITQGSLQVSPYTTYKTAVNLKEYDSIEIEAEVQGYTILKFGTNNAEGSVIFTNENVVYTKGNTTATDTSINSSSFRKFKVIAKGKEVTIIDTVSGKTIVSSSGMRALTTPSEYGYISFTGSYGLLKNIKYTVKPYTIDNTQDGSHKYTKEYGYLNTNYPEDQSWSVLREGNNLSQNLVNSQYLSLRTALTSNITNSFQWNANKDDDISIEARLRIPQTTCAFSASNYLMFSNGDKMGYITFCQNEIRVSGAGLPFTKTLRYNQIFQTLPQNQRNVFAFSANMASEFATFKITLKDGKDIIITTPDNQTFTIANGLYFSATDTANTPYANALVFGSSSNETTTSPDTKADWAYITYKLNSRTQNGKNYTYAYDANLTTPPSAQGWIKNNSNYTEAAVTGQKTFVNSNYMHYTNYWNANTKDTLVIDTTVKSTSGCYGFSDSNTQITFSNGVTKGTVAFCKTGIFISDPSSNNGYRYLRSYAGEPDNATTIDNSTLKNFKIIVKNLDITVLDAGVGKEVATVWGGFNTPVVSGDKNSVTFGGQSSEWKYFKATLSQELASTLSTGDVLRLHFANVQWSILDKTANTLKASFDIAETVPAGTLIEMCTQNTSSTGEPICTKATQSGTHSFGVFPAKATIPLNNNLPVGGNPATFNYQWFIKVNGIPYGVEGPLSVYHSPEILTASTPATDPKIKVIFDTIQDAAATLQVGVAPSQSQYTLEKVCIQKDTGGTETCKINTGTSRNMTNAPSINDQDYNWSMYYSGFTGLTPGTKYKVNITVSRFGSNQPIISGGTLTTHKAPEYKVTSAAIYGIPQDTVIIPRISTVNNIIWTSAGTPAKANIQFDLKDATAKTVEICYKVSGTAANTCNIVTTTTPGTTKTYNGIAAGIDLVTAGTRTYLWNIQVDGKHFGVEGTLTVSPASNIPANPQVSGTSDPAFLQSTISPITDTSAHINVALTAGSTANNPSLNTFCIIDALGNEPVCQINLSYTSTSSTSSGNNYIYDLDVSDLTPGSIYKTQYKINTNSGLQTFTGKSFQTSKSGDVTLVPGEVIISSTDNPVRNISWVTNESGQQYLKVLFDVLNLPTPTTPVALCYKEENNVQATEVCKTATNVSGTLFSVLTDIPLNTTKTYSWYIKIGGEKSGTAGSGLSIDTTPAAPGTSTPATGTQLAEEGITLAITNITENSAVLTATANVGTQVITSLCVARVEDPGNEVCNDQPTPTLQSGNATYTSTFTNLLPGKEYLSSALFTRGLTATDVFSRNGQRFTTATVAGTTIGGEVVVTPPTDTQAPAVVITSPANNSVFSKASDITFSGTSTDLGITTAGTDKIMIGVKSTGSGARWLTLGTEATWETDEVYYPATGTDSWTYNAQGKTISWENGKTYQIFVYGIDKAQNSGKASPASATFTYSLPVDTTAPTSTISLPAAAATSINGTAKDEGTPASGLKNVKVSIKNNTTNKYWNGTAFASDTESYLDAALGGTSGQDTSWSYPATGTILFENSKSYTVHAYAEDNTGNKNNTTPSTRTFTYEDGQAQEVDTQKPTVLIDTIAPADTSIKGSAIDTGTITSGIKNIFVAIKDNSTNKWFTGSEFTETNANYIAAKIQLTGAATATWILPETGSLPFRANISYTISAYGVDTTNNSTVTEPVSKTFTYVPVIVDNGGNNGNSNSSNSNQNNGNLNTNSSNANGNSISNLNSNTVNTNQNIQNGNTNSGNINTNALSNANVNGGNLNVNSITNANTNSSNLNQNNINVNSNSNGNGNTNNQSNTNTNNQSNTNTNSNNNGTHAAASEILSSTPVWAVNTAGVRSVTFTLSKDPGTRPVYFCIDSTCVEAVRQYDGKYYAIVNNTMLPVDKAGTHLWSIKVGNEAIPSNGAVTVNPSLPTPVINTGSNNTYVPSTNTTSPDTTGTTVINNYYTIATGSGSTNTNTGTGSNMNTNSDLKPAPTYCPPTCSTYTLPKDISADHFAAQSIKLLGERNVISGYADGLFKPENPINRAEFAKIVKNGFLLPSNTKAAAMPFKDVSVINWFYTPIRALYNANLVQGYTSGNYLPGRYIQRDEAAKILAVEHANIASAKALQTNTLDSETLGEATITAQWNQWKNENPTFTYVIFPDVSINDWAAKYILYAYNLELITGRNTSEGLRFESKELITRGEASTLLAKIVESLEIRYPSVKGVDEKIQVAFPE